MVAHPQPQSINTRRPERQPRTLSLTDAGEVFGVTRQTIHEWLRKRLLRGVVINGRRRVLATSIDELIERGKRGKA